MNLENRLDAGEIIEKANKRIMNIFKIRYNNIEGNNNDGPRLVKNLYKRFEKRVNRIQKMREKYDMTQEIRIKKDLEIRNDKMNKRLEKAIQIV